jgi:hypothetical protein
MKIYILTPKEALMDFEVGDIFLRPDDNKLYQFVYRDIVRCLVRRWTWWDEVKMFVKLFLKGDNGTKGEPSNGSEGA